MIPNDVSNLLESSKNVEVRNISQRILIVHSDRIASQFQTIFEFSEEDLITLDGSNMTIVACDDEQNVKKTQDPLQQDQQLLKLETQESIQPKIEEELIQLQIPDQQQVSEFVLYQDGEFLTLVPQQQGLPVKAVDRYCVVVI